MSPGKTNTAIKADRSKGSAIIHEPPIEQPDTRLNASETTPDGGYGWVNVGACFSIHAFTWGPISSYGVYLAYYLDHTLYPGASPMDYAIVGGLNFSIAMLVAPIVTIIARIYGPRVPMLIGVVFQTGGFICASFAYHIWHIYLCQGALVGLGAGFAYIPCTAILSQWFTAKRSLANGISTAGSGIGGLIFSFATGAMIHNLSVPWSLRITGIITGITNLTAALLIKHRNEAVQPPQRGLDLHLLRRTDVLLLLSWGFISTLGYMTLFFSLPDFARSIKLTMPQAATTQALMNLGTAIGRPLTGVLSDRFGRIEVAGLLTFACGASVFAIWLPASSYGVLVLFAVISGAIIGVFYVTVGPLSAEIGGLAELPSLLSLAWLSVALPAVFSEVIALKLRRPDSPREYLYPQIFAGMAYLVASVCLFFLRRVTRRRRSQRVI